MYKFLIFGSLGFFGSLISYLENNWNILGAVLLLAFVLVTAKDRNDKEE